MAYECKIIADSLAPNGSRLTTFQVTFPRIILAEINTHRAFSRNSASSRAIPVEKMIERVEKDPFVPIYWGKNQKGMQADQKLNPQEIEAATSEWLYARNHAVSCAEELRTLGVHKQITNRLLEPFLWHTAIVSATDYANFFAQRCHPDAQPEIRRIAEMMRDAYDGGNPKQVGYGFWHLPYLAMEDTGLIEAYVQEYDRAQGGYQPDTDIHFEEVCRRVSVARCARVSYLTQEGKRDISEDLALFDRLVRGSHWSPFEHIAQAQDEQPLYSGNLYGWSQYRKDFAAENRTEYPHG